MILHSLCCCEGLKKIVVPLNITQKGVYLGVGKSSLSVVFLISVIINYDSLRRKISFFALSAAGRLLRLHDSLLLRSIARRLG